MSCPALKRELSLAGWYNVHAWLKEWGPLTEWMLPMTQWHGEKGAYSLLMYTNSMVRGEEAV